MITNFSKTYILYFVIFLKRYIDSGRVLWYETQYTSQEGNYGGYSGEDPPLPIPNREVKLTSADGTAIPSGRVGSRQLQESPDSISCRGFCHLMRIIVFIYKQKRERLSHSLLKSGRSDSNGRPPRP